MANRSRTSSVLSFLAVGLVSTWLMSCANSEGTGAGSGGTGGSGMGQAGTTGSAGTGGSGTPGTGGSGTTGTGGGTTGAGGRGGATGGGGRGGTTGTGGTATGGAGTDGLSSGGNQGFPNTNGQDEMATRAMMADLEAKYCTDRNRYYATGFSYGGSMSYTAACNMSDAFRAIGAMSGAPISGATCTSKKPARPVAVWATHGDADTAFPITLAQPIIDSFVQ